MSRPDCDVPRPSVGWAVTRLFVMATLVNYAWEMAQDGLYLGAKEGIITWWHCLLASFGDGLLVLLIFIIGWMILGRREWFKNPGVRGYLVMLIAGFVISILVEWVMVHVAGQWAYTSQMPVIPGLKVGVSPVAQMLLFPPLIFYLVAAWQRRKNG